ncbi:MAG: NAD(P)/FAD-dependent oxidoreductase [Actinomycetota bacterium]|nr:NAD(P)/FAD-dependent oxidoreductase [Actinomycetota bacterium]
MADKEFDVVVVGAGPAGEVAAGRLAEAGLDVALCERELVGGECSFYACMPSKALVRPAELIGEVGRVPGIELSSDTPTASAVLARRDEVIHDLDDSAQIPWVEDRGIELFRVEARLDGERRVIAGDDVLTARKAVIVATGTTASLPPIPGLAEADPWTSREGTTASEVPESLIVIGGGPVGCELAQAWSSLGSDVVLLEVAPRLISNEEEFASEELTEALREHGVDVRVPVEITNAAGENGRIHVTLESGETLEAEKLMVAAGRTPNTGEIGLETVGLPEGEWIEVNEQMRADGHDWLYAIGDVNKRSLLTHSGKYQARVACETIMGRDATAKADANGPPRVTFTDPQIAAVGLTAEQAAERGINVETLDVSTSGNAGASFHGNNTPGTSRLVIDEDRGVIVGATFVGYQTAELLHSATIAIAGEVPFDRLVEAIPAFPTRTEIWLRFLEKRGL